MSASTVSASSRSPGLESRESAVTGAGVHTSMPHPFPAHEKDNKKPPIVSILTGTRARNMRGCMTQRTDDDVYVPVRETRIDQYTADLLPLATRRPRGRGQVDVHVVRPLEPHACTRLGAQRALVTARADDGQCGKILHEDEAVRGECRRA